MSKQGTVMFPPFFTVNTYNHDIIDDDDDILLILMVIDDRDHSSDNKTFQS